MARIRFGSERDLLSQFDRMQRDFENVASFFAPLFGQRSATRPCHAGVYPPVNVYRDDEGYLVRSEVPGVAPEKLDIEMTGDTLTIRGERTGPEPAGEGTSYHRRERDFGRFQRSLTLPERVDGSKVAAKYEHGVLEVRLPYGEENKKKKIAITSN